ncbi:MAG TPA: hypothetical protein VEM93_03560 [Actinomycetota bacterium]|nr:hypothetical protein [Actinomycetota bacterium]
MGENMDQVVPSADGLAEGWEPKDGPAGEGASSPSEPVEVRTMDQIQTESMPSFLRDEVAPLLAAAEQAAAQIIERAKVEAREQNAEFEQMRRREEARAAEMVAWLDQMEPSLKALQAKVADIHSKIDQVPELVRKALDPVAEAISSLNPTLREISGAARPALEAGPTPAGSPT